MKNIETILSEYGIELTDEQKTGINKAVNENYKPVADWQKQVDKVTNLTDQLSSAKKSLEKFDGLDPEALNNEIQTLNQKLADKDAEYQSKIAERDFQDLLKDCISAVNGKNAKAIAALLDIDTLKASKNQKEDVTAALKALSEAEDSKMLFGESKKLIKKGNVIGEVTSEGAEDSTASLKDALKEAYEN